MGARKNRNISKNKKAERTYFSILLFDSNFTNVPNYVLLPEDFYKIDNPSIEIPNDLDLVKSAVSYDPVKIKNKTGYDKEYYALPLRLIPENGFPVFSKERSEMLLTFVVSEPTVRILNPGFFTLDLADPNVKSLDVKIGVEFTNKWDIEILLANNQSAVDTYNLANGTYYSLMPSAMYEQPKNIRLAKGETFYNASYTINKDKLLPGNYLLPVQIKEITSKLGGNVTDVIKFDANSNTTFAFSKMGNKISKKEWTIESFTTEEPAEGQWGNGGKAIHLIDDNPSTFWHAKWASGSDPLPYQITINMQEEHLVSQIEILPRGQGSNNPIKVLAFETSINGTDWQFVGKFPFKNTNEALMYAVKATQAKYIRMSLPIPENTSTIAAVRELTAYGE